MKDSPSASPPPAPLAVNLRSFLSINWVYFLGLALFLAIATYFLFTTQQGELEMTINRYRSPANDRIWLLVTQLAEEKVYLLGALILATFSYRKAITFGLMGILVGIVSALLKAVFAAPRPMRWFYDYALDNWHQLFRFEDTASSWAYTSFPSGHATSAFAIYGFLAFTVQGKMKPWLGLLAVICAISVAISRQYLLFHFLKDVTAGALLGTALASLLYLTQDRLFSDYPSLDRGFLARTPLV